MNSLILLSVCFTIYSLVLAWLFMTTEGRLKSKIILSTLFVFMSINVAFSFNSFLGYPTKETYPANSVMLHAVIREPNEYTHDKGAIYVWLQSPPQENVFSVWSMFQFKNEGNDPRVYFIPYSKESQKSVQKGKDGLKQGKVVTMSPREGKKKAPQNFYSERDTEDQPNVPEINLYDPEAVRGKVTN